MIKDKALGGNIKVHHYPLSIQINPLYGILNFPSQSSSTVLQKPLINVQTFKQQITYKNALMQSDSQQSENEDQVVTKKTNQIRKVTIKPQNMKKKYYKVNIPVNKSIFHNKNKQKIHFVIEFGNEKNGVITVVDDFYDAKMEIVNQNQNKLTFDQKIKAQNAKLDNRRRQQKIQVVQEKKDNRKKITQKQK